MSKFDNPMSKSKFINLVAIAFFGFILWIIYLANTGSSSVFFPLMRSIPYGDKIGHFFLFGSLALVFNFAFELKCLNLVQIDLGKIWLNKLAPVKIKIYFGTLFVSLFVSLEEISQMFIPARTFGWQDLLADFLGISCFTLITFVLAKLLAPKSDA